MALGSAALGAFALSGTADPSPPGLIQVIPWSTVQQLGSASSFNYYWDLLAGCAQSGSGSEDPCQVPVAAGGTFRNFCVALGAAPGATKSRTLTVRINGADTALTVTISGAATSASVTGVDVAVTAGDTITIKETSVNDPSGTHHSGTIEFESTGGYISIYGGGGLGFVPGAVTRFDGALRAAGQLHIFSASEAAQPVAAAGDFTALYGWTSGASGAGNGVTLYFNLNGVRQDGTGSTVDTTLSLVSTGGAGSLSSSFTLPVVEADVVYIEVVMAASLGSVFYSLGVQFTATTAGEYMIAGYRGSQVTDTEKWFAVPQMDATNKASATAAGASFACGPTDIVLSTPRLILDTAPGVGKTREVVLQRNGTDTPVLMTVYNLALNAMSPLSQAFVDGDRIGLRAFGTGTAAATGFAWTYRTGPAPDPEEIPEEPIDPPIEPTPAEIPTGIVRTFVRFTLEDGSPATEMAFAETTLRDPASWFGGLKRPFLTSVSPFTRHLSDSLQGVSVNLSFVDDAEDRVFRMLAASGTISGALVEIFLVSDEVRYALGEPYRRFAGRVASVRFTSSFGVDVTCIDLQSDAMTFYGDSALVPPVKLSLTEFPLMDAQFEGKAIPIVFGQCSDTFEPGNIDTLPQGVIPPVIVIAYEPGTTTAVVNFSDFGGVNQDVICAILSHGAFSITTTSFVEVYFNTPTDPYRRIPVPPSAWGVYMWMPGMPGWASTGITTPMYADYPLPLSAATRRYTPFFVDATHPYAPLYVDGKILVGINCIGLSDTSMGGGPPLLEAPHIWQWLLTHYLFTQWLTGTYHAVPLLATGYSLINTLSVTASVTKLQSFNSGSYQVGFMLGRGGQQQTLRHVLEEICYGVGMEQGIDRHGRLMLDVEDPEEAASVALSDLFDIEDGQFEVWIERSEYFNKIEYVHGYRYLPPVAPIPAPASGEPLPTNAVPRYGDWTSGLQVVESLAAKAANGGRETKKFVENYIVRDPVVAANVEARRLAQAIGPSPSLDGPRKFRLTTSYQGLGTPGSIGSPFTQIEVELGTVIEIDHIEGLGPGYIGQRARVMSITDDLQNARIILEGRVYSASLIVEE